MTAFAHAKSAMLIALLAIVAGGVFAQKAGDTFTARKAQTSGDLSFTAVSNSPFGTSSVYGVAFGGNIWVAVGGGADRNETGKIAYSN